ncbi:MAG: hypothetical protein KZQ95_12160 [Candidatus Thiodiazotropha sp. (ex Epidulcina cf. delphinae)]|nr:hypothetical protein [Candidatus Thiodiazotropha sp. (ex Epidulcina cf. delphinae)]
MKKPITINDKPGARLNSVPNMRIEYDLKPTKPSVSIIHYQKPMWVRQGRALIGIDLLTIAACFHLFPIFFNSLGSGHALHAVVRIVDRFHHEGHEEHEGVIARIA